MPLEARGTASWELELDGDELPDRGVLGTSPGPSARAASALTIEPLADLINCRLYFYIFDVGD